MANYDVTRTRRDGSDDDLLLEGLGGDGWYHTVDQAIANITRGDTYWVDAGRRAPVVVLTCPRSKRPYLTTEPDGLCRNNLLCLPEC